MWNIRFIDPGHNDARDILKMINGLDHRGPDASGFKTHVNDDCIVALGHTRLSIDIIIMSNLWNLEAFLFLIMGRYTTI